MKRSYSLFIFIVVLTAACNKKLDVVPEDKLVEKQVFENAQNTLSFLSEAYFNLFKGTTGNTYAVGDLTTGIIANSPFQSDPAYTGDYDPVNNVPTIWATNYYTVNLANIIINRLPGLGTFSDSLKSQYVAEAKFIRAFAYSTLLKMYGDGALENKMSNAGVPLQLTPFDGYDGSTQNIPRSTNAAVYSQILKDLQEAYAGVPASYGNDVDTRSRATKTAVRALMARVALYMRDYDNAVLYSNDVLNAPGYSLGNTILDVFPDNSAQKGKLSMNIPELIFAFPTSWMTASSGPASAYIDHGLYYFFGFPFVKQEFIDSYAAFDMRGQSFFIAGAPWSAYKTPLKFSSPTAQDHLVAMRLAETMLIKAEALANRNGVSQEAVDLLNTIHQRAFQAPNKPALFTTGSFSDKQELLTAIWQERTWELACEGFDREDHIRTGRQPNPVLPAGKYALPIPNVDITLSGGLIKQNPGY